MTLVTWFILWDYSSTIFFNAMDLLWLFNIFLTSVILMLQ